jgi:predicted enzyme related to lactoylglutathione lyase
MPSTGDDSPAARIYREHPDSSYLTAPRIFARVFVEPGGLVDAVGFYGQLTGRRLDMDADIPEAGLHVVAVGSFLLIEMDAEQHGLAAQTTVTVLNADLDAAVARQVAAGAEIVQERWESAVGPGARLRHPDGLIVEYVEHRPGDDDVAAPGPAFR